MARSSRFVRRLRCALASLLLPVVSLATACANAGRASEPLDGGAAQGVAGSSGNGNVASAGSASTGAGGVGATSGEAGGDAAGNGNGAGDAAGSGSGGSARSADGGADGGCTASAPAVQDDFESGSLGGWQITDPFGNPIPSGSAQVSVAIDTTRAHSGTHSVKVHAGGLFGAAPPAAAFYGRVWAWLGASPGEVPNGGHWGWIIGVGAGDASQATEVRMGGQFGILIDNYSLNDDVVLSDPNFFNDGMDGGTRAPVGAWVCVEFYFGKDSLRTWMAGSEIASLDVTPSTTWAHGMKAPWSPAYTSIRIGYANYNANAIDVWYDDVAIGAARICCP